MQVQQRQDLGDLGTLATPRRQDQRAKPHPRARGRVDPPVVHSRRAHRDRTRGGGDLPLAGVAVAHHQPAAVLVALGGVGGEVGVDLGFQGGGEQPLGALAHDRVQVQTQLTRPARG
jgi:hypothetical protein